MILSNIDYEKIFLGIPIPFEDICMIYPIKMGDFILMDKENYSDLVMILTIDEGDLEEIFNNPNNKEKISFTPFSYLIQRSKIDKTFFLKSKVAFRTFIQEEILMLDDKIIIGDPEDKRFLTEKNFPYFQNIIRVCLGIKPVEIPPEDEDIMAKKFRLKRAMRDRAKKKKKAKIDSNKTLADIMSSVCVGVPGLTPFNIKDLTVYAFYELYGRMMEKQSFEIKCSGLAFGGKAPEDWTTHLED